MDDPIYSSPSGEMVVIYVDGVTVLAPVESIYVPKFEDEEQREEE